MQRSTGGKDRLGRTSRMDQRSLRRLLIIAVSAVVRWAKRKGFRADSWLGQLIARIAWVLLTKGGICRAAAVIA